MSDTIAIKEENEMIALKFFEIREHLSSPANAVELYEMILREMEVKFEIPYVWCSVASLPICENLISFLKSSSIITGRLNLIESASLHELFADDKKPILANSDLKRFFKLLPKNNKYFLKSVAIAPVLIDGIIIGTINCGDARKDRYSPEMDATLLLETVEKFAFYLAPMMRACE